MKCITSLCVYASLILLAGCGSGGSSHTPAEDFSISLSSGAVSQQAGGVGSQFKVLVGSDNGFSGSVTLSISGLPVGVTTSPAFPVAVPAGSSQAVMLNIPASVAPGSFQATFTGNSGALSHSTALALTVTAAATAAISVGPPSISLGESVTITWSSTNATSCTAANDWSGTIPTSGTQQITPTVAGPMVYSISCGSARASANLTVNQGQARGGSDYAWYQLDMPSCNREPYGVMFNYDTAIATIHSQLQTMYSNGQRRLRIPIFHGRGLSTGTIMDSTGGTLAPRFLNNLTNLLADIKSVGFEEIEVSLHPQGPNFPASWTSYSSDYFTENWELIQTLHPIIAGAGIKYYLDLMNEGIPTASQTALMEYSQNLWSVYAAKYGTSDTVGFSIIPDADRLPEISTVYGQNATPPVFDLHFYSNAGANFGNAFATLTAAGFSGKPWILGEAYYNDATEASQLRQQIDATGQRVYFLMQWPLTSAVTCQDVDVTPPVDFSNYIGENF